MKKEKKTAPKAAKSVKTVKKTLEVAEKAASTVKAEPEQQRTPPAPTFFPFDPDAKDWVFGVGIPGAYNPILYLGEKVPREISRLLGRPLTLEETQHLVCADGDREVCATCGKEFIPVKYLPFVPWDLTRKLAEKIPLTDIGLPWGGAFYANHKNELEGFCGSVFHHFVDKRSGKSVYEWHTHNDLVDMAAKVAKQQGRPGEKDWGVPREQALKSCAAYIAQEKREQKSIEIAKRLRPNHITPARWTNSTRDAYKNAKPLKSKGHRDDDHHNGDRSPRPRVETEE